MKTDPKTWNELGLLLLSVLELPPEERTDFLDSACRARPDLRAEVESLLAAYEDAPAYFDDLGARLRPLSEAPGDDTDPADPYRLVGRALRHYAVRSVLGGGGMGVVYRADDTRLKRPVALKFLPPYLSRDAAAKQRFMREAQAASALDHPNICTIHEVGETPEGQLFIAMACYQGETLRSRIERGPLPFDEAVGLALQTARGLVKAHAHGIIHRDVKPANLMITEEGVVKILDFGLAKLSSGAHLTQTGAALGTAAYMSPEQARGDAVDHRTDIWAFGVVLYEMLAGRRPFDGDFAPAVLYSVLNQDPQPITGLRSGLPMQIGLLIDRALSKSVEGRYQHMADLLTDLQALHDRKTARTRAERAVLPSSITAPPEPEPPEEHAPVTILVVDDEPELELLIRQKFRRKIRKNEWRFLFATDGREALRRLQDHPEATLILTDLNMPGMDGLTLLSHLTEWNPPVKTVVVSAYGDMNNIRTAMNRGAFDFVTKPIDFTDLEATIRKTRQELQAQRKAAEARRQLVSLKKELEVARRIQEAILPLSFPRREDLDLYAFSTTAGDVGGAFYDFFPAGDRRFGFLIGDVAGKGIPAALFMAISQTFLKGVALQGAAPGDCLSSLNRLLFPDGFPELYVTTFYGLLDTGTGELSYANAGHPVPYRLRTDGAVTPLNGLREPPIWQTRDQTFTTRHTRLTPDEGLFLFTRGMIDAADTHGHAFSADRLAACLREAHGADAARLIRSAVRSVMQHADPLQEDLTVLALRYRNHG
jgi:sigma-B regulation protein RsbU (phosphoserine phosphatase)